jgi:hypothetical protein
MQPKPPNYAFPQILRKRPIEPHDYNEFSLIRQSTKRLNTLSSYKHNPSQHASTDLPQTTTQGNPLNQSQFTESDIENNTSQFGDDLKTFSEAQMLFFTSLLKMRNVFNRKMKTLMLSINKLGYFCWVL